MSRHQFLRFLRWCSRKKKKSREKRRRRRLISICERLLSVFFRRFSRPSAENPLGFRWGGTVFCCVRGKLVKIFTRVVSWLCGGKKQWNQCSEKVQKSYWSWCQTAQPSAECLLEVPVFQHRRREDEKTTPLTNCGFLLL